MQTLERNKTESDASMISQNFQSPRRVMSSVNHVFEPYSIVNDGDSNTPRNIYINISNINTKPGLEIPGEYPPKDTIAEEDGDVYEDDTDLESSRSESYFKVDFKVEESHASLKLFLPHINGYKDPIDGESVENENRPSVNQVKFPPLIQSNGDSSQSRTFSGIRKSYKRTLPPSKRKRRKIERCPSASDGDNRVKDHLNDVPTLVSLDKEGCKSLLHSKDTLCSFENCPYHSK
ncbi:hypothetical protein FSP39_016803 [Pinctada imbricata]|uniref:Uncharacterized protein n=1 Tax=Pinctada imbricata TaxID=66713 RepID=A0AA88YFF4_PINIB|nr:hypothetical protein FSP39_016803 [Pinctada imbricata]